MLQKSLREGFGLTVSEAMWKGTPVIGGNVGGIRLQIEDGEDGFLVESPEQCAERMLRLLGDPGRARADGPPGPRDRPRAVPHVPGAPGHLGDARKARLSRGSVAAPAGVSYRRAASWEAARATRFGFALSL